MTTLELCKLAIIRAKIELECVDDPTISDPRGRKLVRESTINTINMALKRLDREIIEKR